MPPTPLPKASSSEVTSTFEEDPNQLSAYNICLNYESELASANESENKLRHVRIIGFLLLHAPNVNIRAEVCKCIYSCKDSSDLSDVGEFFERHLIFTLKRHRGTPNPTEHSSRSSFETTKEQVKVDITQAPRDHKAAKALALIRDNWRCVVTGFVDRGAPEDIIAQERYGVYTRCAHIIPESTFFGVDSKSEDERTLNYSAVLKQFHYDIEKFNGEKVHALTNVMSLQVDVRTAFERLELYFESTPASPENTYEIKTCGPLPPSLKQSVTFTTSDPVNLPVPLPELLSLHATCCKVAHLSGAREYIDTVYLDADNMDVLSADGASGDMLSYMLSSASKRELRFMLD